jgi:hypothetical protein
MYMEERREVLEGVSTGGWCSYNLGMGPGYPGLDESEEFMCQLECSPLGRRLV